MAAVEPPNLALEIDALTDWMELTALFDQFGVARVDALLGSLKQLEETAEDDIGRRDQIRDQLIEALENEVSLRRRSLGASYPFRLSDDGDELEIDADWREIRFAFYLVCLISAHLPSSPILRSIDDDQIIFRLRNRIFQMIATLGLAGYANGPAFSVGWPRQSGQTISQLLERAAAEGGGFTVRNPPGIYVAPQEKDGGVDVIAFTREIVPPPSNFFYAQSASGRNWPGKSVYEHMRQFSSNYIQDQMTGNVTCITIIPDRVTDERFWNAQHQSHRAILDRLRLPLRAVHGLAVAASGHVVDDSENVHEITEWLGDYIQTASAA